MLETARSKNVVTSACEAVNFEVSTAEDMNLIADSSVDLLTAANAIHWFSLPEFWRKAARVLKPGGNVALIRSWIFLAHPTMPNATKIQQAVDSFLYETWKALPGSHLWYVDRWPKVETIAYATMEKGDAFCMLGGTYHAEGASTTANQERPHA